MHYLQITRLLRTSLLAQEPSLKKNFLHLEKKTHNTFLLCKLVPRRDLFRNMILHSEFKRKNATAYNP